MVAVTEAEIRRELGDAVTIPAVVTLCLQLCRHEELTALDLSEYWEAFSMASSINQLEEDTVKMLARYIEDEKKKEKRMEKTPSRQYSKRREGSTAKDFDKDSLHLLEDMYASPASNRKRTPYSYKTPEFKKHAVTSNTVSPGMFASPASLVDFSHRNNAGKVELVFNEHVPTHIKNRDGINQEIDVAVYGSCQVNEYRYMFEKLQEKAEELDDRLTYLGYGVICPRHKIEETGRLGVPCTDQVTVVGRVCCDGVGRMNEKSVVIEGCKEKSGGVRVPLDLSEMEAFSLFPGQIIAVEGYNTQGNRMVAKKIYQNARRPFATTPVQELAAKSEGSGLQIISAVGPFTTNNDMSYQPLDELISLVQKERPDVLILMGPFVDDKHPMVSDPSQIMDVTFAEVFSQEIVSRIFSLLEKTPNLQVVIMPSLRDVHHDFVLPQPPLKINMPEEFIGRLHSMPNPCTLAINEVTVGLTTTDIVMHMSAEETFRFPSGSQSDRFGRLVNHLVEQRSYYPLLPAKDTNIDFGHLEQLEMPCTPDLLLLGSDMKYFAKNVNGCLAVNPGRLTRAQSGATFARLTIHPLQPDMTKTKPSQHYVLSRSRVEIVRI